MELCSSKAIGILRNLVIGLSELVIGIVGIRKPLLAAPEPANEFETLHKSV